MSSTGNSEEHEFILVDGFQGFHPWPLGIVYLGKMSHQQKHVLEESGLHTDVCGGRWGQRLLYTAFGCALGTQTQVLRLLQ